MYHIVGMKTKTCLFAGFHGWIHKRTSLHECSVAMVSQVWFRTAYSHFQASWRMKFCIAFFLFPTVLALYNSAYLVNNFASRTFTYCSSFVMKLFCVC